MVGPAFSLKLVGPWTVGGSKNESGPNTTWSTPACAKQRAGTRGWLAASAGPGSSADTAPTGASTAVSAIARTMTAREMDVLKRFMSFLNFFWSGRTAPGEPAREVRLAGSKVRVARAHGVPLGLVCGAGCGATGRVIRWPLG